MRNQRNYWTALLFFVVAFLTVRCSNNDEIKVDPNANYDVVLDVTEAAPTPDKILIVDANVKSTVLAKVTFTSTTKSMKRLYITQNITNKGETIYKPTESIDLKADGAVDLTGKNDKSFEYQFILPVPSGLGTNGTVVYKFWTTTGNGDFRDVSKRLAVGAGTITLKAGTGSNPTGAVKTYSDKKLSAPLADGSSSTFISLLDGQVFKINQGAEYVAFWDFGYFYRTNPDFLWQASLSSAADYLIGIVNIPSVANTTEPLNKVYFKLSTKSVTEFNAITTSSDLDFIVKSSEQTIKNLKADDIIEFVDQYNKKGLIRVKQISGTDGSSGFILIDIKVQP